MYYVSQLKKDFCSLDGGGGGGGGDDDDDPLSFRFSPHFGKESFLASCEPGVLLSAAK